MKLRVPTGCRFVWKRFPTRGGFCLSVNHRKSLFWVSPRKIYFCFKVTCRIFEKQQSHPQNDDYALMLPTEKCFISKLPTENRNCWSLPTKEDFFEKLPTEEIGATYIWNKAFCLRTMLCLFVQTYRLFRSKPFLSKTNPARWPRRLALVWATRAKKLTLSEFNNFKSPGQSFHEWHFLDQIAPSPWSVMIVDNSPNMHNTGLFPVVSMQEKWRFQRAFRSKFELVPSPFWFVLKTFVCTVPPGTILIPIELAMHLAAARHQGRSKPGGEKKWGVNSGSLSVSCKLPASIAT